MARPQRLIELLAALRARRRTTAEALAAELGVSTRTVLRDVQALVDAGIPVFTERGRYGGISLLPGDQVDLSKLTTAEADVLRAVGLDLDRARQLGEEAVARSALGKLVPRRTPAAPAELPLSLHQVVAVDNRAWFADGEPGPDVARLAQDLRRGRRLRIRYRRSGSTTARPAVVDPYGLLLRADRWYLIADRDAQPRMYALSRLRDWEVLAEPRRLREGEDLAGVAAELGRELESRHEVTVTARLDADRVDLAHRVLGSRLRTVGEAADGRVTITVSYDQLDGVRQLLQFADHIEVVDPEPARRLVHDLARQLARAHEGTP
ncbi:putative DNA-binding transcriptional regulator YafY [Saccharothrix coeruleofusca]|uniref:helix-turn-helix transcriptional regulator n=1 Tax=Saccharothrix coeruleofusca TaxID=33919 RepID=UPI001AE19932|nr:WYL domain-containing protein [Saccharothrix coeruleofusca]MBP2337572.1 putative DNA-binding transcriptional regulator YafY [Saccharothrix coeruleofusca]